MSLVHFLKHDLYLDSALITSDFGTAGLPVSGSVTNAGEDGAKLARGEPTRAQLSVPATTDAAIRKPRVTLPTPHPTCSKGMSYAPRDEAETGRNEVMHRSSTAECTCNRGYQHSEEGHHKPHPIGAIQDQSGKGLHKPLPISTFPTQLLE